MDDGLRLPPLHCCYLGPHDFYRRVYCGSSAVVRTVASGALDHTRAYFSRPSLLHLNSVAGELVGLVPVLRRTHVALRTWLARNHPSNWRVVPDSLRTEWESGRDARAFEDYLQHELGVMPEPWVVPRRPCG